ncbi:hypothetical protein F6R97_28895 [Pseudomonas sp. JV414]|nr:hypothetical protein [Pseudomonas sp. JV414]
MEWDSSWAGIAVSLTGSFSIRRKDCNVSQLSKIHVGAGLLAKAVCQATSMLTVPPSSRASPLPQVSHLN